MNNLTVQLKGLRKAKKVTQKAVAENINIAIRAYQYYESGEREPTLSILIALADYFDVSLDYLVGRSEIKERR